MGATTKNRKAVRPLQDYRECAEQALLDCIASGKPFTVDTVRLTMPSDVTDVHHNVLPNLMSRYRRSGRIVRVGYVQSPNRSRHGGINALWLAASDY